MKKKICLICEGSYPYIVGGVSSWVNQLIRLHTDYEFSVVALIPSAEFATPKYEIPDNLTNIVDVLLNNHPIPEYFDFDRRYSVIPEIKTNIKKIFDFENLTSEELIGSIAYFSSFSKEEQLKIVLSNSFWNAIMEHYKEKKYDKGLSQYYWTYRNLFLNFISLGNVELPEADIYHSVSTGYAGALLALGKFRGKGKTLITEHGIYFREREEDILGSEWINAKFKEEWINFFEVMCTAAYNYSDKLITLFNYNMQYAIEHGVPKEKIYVVPNGIDVEGYSQIVRTKKEIFSIGSVLRVVPIKDVKMMIKGFKIALMEIPEAHLYLIGPTDEDPEYFEECKELITELEIEEHITFTGKANVKDYYSFLEVFLLSSISEGQPLSILEALASGIPCISTNVGNCKEILLEKTDIGEAGIIVPPTSYKELGQAIIELYKKRDTLDILGKNGIEIVKKYYSKDSFEANYKKIYKELIEGE